MAVTDWLRKIFGVQSNSQEMPAEVAVPSSQREVSAEVDFTDRHLSLPPDELRKDLLATLDREQWGVALQKGQILRVPIAIYEGRLSLEPSVSGEGAVSISVKDAAGKVLFQENFFLSVVSGKNAADLSASDFVVVRGTENRPGRYEVDHQSIPSDAVTFSLLGGYLSIGCNVGSATISGFHPAHTEAIQTVDEIVARAEDQQEAEKQMLKAQKKVEAYQALCKKAKEQAPLAAVLDEAWKGYKTLADKETVQQKTDERFSNEQYAFGNIERAGSPLGLTGSAQEILEQLQTNTDLRVAVAEKLYVRLGQMLADKPESFGNRVRNNDSKISNGSYTIKSSSQTFVVRLALSMLDGTWARHDASHFSARIGDGNKGDDGVENDQHRSAARALINNFASEAEHLKHRTRFALGRQPAQGSNVCTPGLGKGEQPSKPGSRTAQEPSVVGRSG